MSILDSNVIIGNFGLNSKPKSGQVASIESADNSPFQKLLEQQKSEMNKIHVEREIISEVTKHNPADNYSDVEKDFLLYANMTPAERIRAQILADEGISEEEFGKLSIEDQNKIIAKIRERIEMMTEQENKADGGLIG